MLRPPRIEFLIPVLALLLSACVAPPMFLKTGSTGPTVVFQNGIGDSADKWKDVIRKLDASDSVFSFDRPGHVGSTLPDGPRDPCTIASELHNLLHGTGVNPPYVLVGAEHGSLYQYAFVKLFPGEVAGMLLIEPQHPGLLDAMKARDPDVAEIIAMLESAPWMSIAERREYRDFRLCISNLRGRAAPNAPMRILVKAQDAKLRAKYRDIEDDWLILLPGVVRVESNLGGDANLLAQPDRIAAEVKYLLNIIRRPRQ